MTTATLTAPAAAAPAAVRPSLDERIQSLTPAQRQLAIGVFGGAAVGSLMVAPALFQAVLLASKVCG